MTLQSKIGCDMNTVLWIIAVEVIVGFAAGSILYFWILRKIAKKGKQP